MKRHDDVDPRNDSVLPPHPSIRLLAAFSEVDAYWDQRVIATVNGQLVKIAKGYGATHWHHHADQDEAFLVIRGALIVETADASETLHPSHFRVVPRGVRHRVVAEEEAWFVVIGTGITSTPEGGRPDVDSAPAS